VIALLGLLVSVIFFFLSAIHLNWVFGGTWGFDNVLPTNTHGQRVLNPRKLDSAIIGLGLGLIGCFYLMKSGLTPMVLSYWIDTLLGWVVPILFLVRSIGDFKYIGFFKKVTSTKFARQDSKFYSPLSFMLSLLGMVIHYFN